MANSPTKRRYCNQLEFVESGFRACWRNAQDLVSSSKLLIDSGFHAPALSLDVLALEELGKLMAIDGLLYARHDDYKASAFRKSVKNHAAKLSNLEVFPLLLLAISLADPRHGKDERFDVALEIGGQNLKEAGNAVIAELGGESFLGLDELKQQGFYVSARQVNGRLLAPFETVRLPLANAVHHFAWLATSTLDFLFKGGNLERYIENGRSVRDALTEEGHQELERRGKEEFAKLFLREGERAESSGLTTDAN